MSHKIRNPYRPLRAFAGAQEARRLCPTWRMVTVALGATAPGRPWYRSAFAPDRQPPPLGTPGDGPPSWCELDHTGKSTWRDGTPPAPVGVICDQDWQPVRYETPGGHKLPRLDALADAEDEA